MRSTILHSGIAAVSLGKAKLLQEYGVISKIFNEAEAESCLSKPYGLYNFASLAEEIKQSVLNCGEIFGYKIHLDR